MKRLALVLWLALSPSALASDLDDAIKALNEAAANLTTQREAVGKLEAAIAVGNARLVQARLNEWHAAAEARAAIARLEELVGPVHPRQLAPVRYAPARASPPPRSTAVVYTTMPHPIYYSAPSTTISQAPCAGGLCPVPW